MSRQNPAKYGLVPQVHKAKKRDECPPAAPLTNGPKTHIKDKWAEGHNMFISY